MASLWATVLLALLAAALLTFGFIRLQLHKLQASGRASFIAGGVLVLVAAAWNVIQSIPSYSTWFIITAYPILSAVMYLVLAIGLSLIAVALALYADYHRSRREDVEVRENRLGLLQTLQQETRASYQLLELLNLTLREILVQNPERAGAVFLINRGKRQLVLGATTNLTKNEQAYLEHFTLDRNVVAQAIDLGDPMIAGAFELSDAKGMPVQSRFQSTLVLPLISGSERIGAIVLVAEEPRSFTRVEMLYLAPVADWVAEKIRTARLTRELSLAKSELEQLSAKQHGLIERLSASAQTLSGSGNVADFCRQLVGMAGSSEVYLCGLAQGTMQVYGGTETLNDLTEQYKLTLSDALERRKPLIINHESSDRDGHSSIVRSSLVFPVAADSSDALLLRKEGGPFQVGDQDLRLLSFFGLLAKFALLQRESSRRDLARRLGFDKVVQLIRPTDDSYGRSEVGFFVRHLSDILPNFSQAITLVRHTNGSFSAADSFRIDQTELVDLLIEAGEGMVGEAVSTCSPRFVYGKRNVLAAIEAFGPSTQHILHRSFGERRLPQMITVCPLISNDEVTEVALFFFYEIPETERMEWERMLTLAVGLYALRRNMADLNRRAGVVELSPEESDRLAPLINQLNNHLSAVIGNADLASSREEVSGELRVQLKSIAAEAERAAQLIKKTILLQPTPEKAITEGVADSLNQIVNSVLREVHISGDLYMAGGRAREIDLKLGQSSAILFKNDEIRQLFEAVLNRFAVIASDEDVISIATYQSDGYVYLDISRHRKNFPPVEPVASFGEYQLAEQAFQHRPADIFLKSVSQGTCYYAADKTGPTPAYLSFKFPVKTVSTAIQTPSKGRQFRVLAIDDQAVILDLISAMCQSLGYQVQTASNGTDGLKLAGSGRFDIVLTDLAMPDLTGLEVARQIRQLQPDVPIILVTGWEAGLDQTEIGAAGITEVLLKPFRIEQLTDIIRAVAAKRG